LYQTFASFKEEALGFKRIVEPYIKSHVFAVFDRRDLAPFAARTQHLIRQIVLE
jgi:hypothetical protein